MKVALLVGVDGWAYNTTSSNPNVVSSILIVDNFGILDRLTCQMLTTFLSTFHLLSMLANSFPNSNLNPLTLTLIQTFTLTPSPNPNFNR